MVGINNASNIMPSTLDIMPSSIENNKGNTETKVNQIYFLFILILKLYRKAVAPNTIVIRNIAEPITVPIATPDNPFNAPAIPAERFSGSNPEKMTPIANVEIPARIENATAL